VLDAFDELKVCSAYKVDGVEQQEVPYQMTKVTIDPVYVSAEGWNTDTTKLTDYASLPVRMKNYVSHINNYLGVDIKYISNGPGREQIIPAL
jgi:adenylosuccinate synthase